MRKFDTSDKRLKIITKNTIKCKCGHSVLMSRDKVICTHCGNYVYKDKLTEFKEKMIKEMKNEKRISD